MREPPLADGVDVIAAHFGRNPPAYLPTGQFERVCMEMYVAKARLRRVSRLLVWVRVRWFALGVVVGATVEAWREAIL